MHDFVPVGGVATFVNTFAVSGGNPAKTFANGPLTAMGLAVGYMAPQQLATRRQAYQQAYIQAWAQIIKSSGFVAQ